jgi:hypothetical protein
LLEALPTEDGPALRRFEGHSSLLPTPGTTGSGLHSRVVAWRGASQGGDAFRFAGFTTFGLVLELFVVEKELFTGSKNEVGAAVDTFQNLILEFHGELLPSARDSRAMDRVKLQPVVRTGLSVQAGGRKFPVLRYIPWVRPTML